MQMTKKLSVNTQKMDHLIALLVALAVTIHILESAMPSLIPGVKPGLANIVTILVFFHFGIHQSGCFISRQFLQSHRCYHTLVTMPKSRKFLPTSPSHPVLRSMDLFVWRRRDIAGSKFGTFGLGGAQNPE